jgi:PAS domain-containing protein
MVANGALEIVEYSSRVLNLFGLEESGTGQDHEALTRFVAAEEELGDNLALATARLTLAGDEESLRWSWRERTYDVTVSALEEGDQFLVVLDDATEQEMTAEIQLNARHYLEHILGDISVGVVVLNEQLRITSINQHMLTLVARAGRGLDLVDAIGSLADETFPAEWGTRVQELSGDVLATGERSPEVEHAFETASGNSSQQLVITSAVTPLRDRSGQLSGAIVMSTDITERRRLEAELLRMEKLATVGQMVVTLNHEINNPLGIISTNAQALRLLNRDLDEKTTKKLVAIEEQVKRIAAVTERLRSMDEVASEEYIAEGPQMIDVWGRTPSADSETGTEP